MPESDPIVAYKEYFQILSGIMEIFLSGKVALPQHSANAGQDIDYIYEI